MIERDLPEGPVQASSGSAQQQPGVTEQDVGGDAPHVSQEDVEIVSPDEVAAPPAAVDEQRSRVNADLVDDVEELVNTIEQASGERPEVVHEGDID